MMKTNIISILVIFLFFISNQTIAQENGQNQCNCKNYSQTNFQKCVRSSFSNYFSSINGLDCYFDFDEGLQCAKISNKPCIVYFTAHSSIKSRKMESKILTNSAILKTIKENYIFIKLLKDDKMELTPFYQVVNSTSDDTIKEFGKKSIHYQEKLFNENVHPAFYIIDLNKKQITNPIYYGYSVKDFKRSLQKGIKNFKIKENSFSESPKFVLRIHRNHEKLNYYQVQGSTNCSDFINLFRSIDWETEFVEETENERFNFSDIEVINKNNSLYFSITTGPYKDASYQYIVGLGYHQNRIDQVSRIVKLYGTQTTDQSKITRLIKNFFCNDIIHLTKQLEQLDFLIELNDTYHNY